VNGQEKRLKIGIIGAAGLSAGKLMELLLRHPSAELFCLVSESSPGAPVTSSHPQLRGRTALRFDDMDFDKLAECDVVFSAKKAGDSFRYIEKLVAGKSRVIDLSGDYRLTAPEDFQTWYKLDHLHTSLLGTAVYGLPELHRERIRTAQLLANPGCYTTTSILACAPFVRQGHGLQSPIIVDAISGVSGAGRNAKPENQYLSVAENVRAYRIGNHQHTPEIEQELSRAAGNGSKITMLFVPHVGPYKAGIMATCYLRAKDGKGLTENGLYDVLSETYSGEPFVRVYEPGSLPQIEHVVGTNFCDIGATYDPRTQTIVVISVTDNLIKGAAGQAIQNMNIMFGLPETAGLL
jgi:N-acetyl-gamma-glutamyl-phosphate reductase